MRATLARVIHQAQAAADPGAYRWVAPELLHVTLAFLGNRPATDLPALDAAGQRATRHSAPFRLALEGFGAFGPPRAPRVLWAALGGDLDALRRLHATLGDALRAAGMPLPEDGAFRPHVTLARRRPSAPPGAGGWPPRARPADGAWSVAELVLMRSELAPAGPRYTPLQRFALRG